MTGLANAEWIDAVDLAWGDIRRLHPEVPAVRLALGHQASAAHRWAHYAVNGAAGPPELYLSYIAQHELEANQLMGVLVHEATHALAAARGVRDCSSQGRWHNDRFHQLAAETGVMLTAGRAANYGADTLNPAAALYYADSTARLALAVSTTASR